jgi:hypothetical protein
MIKLREQELGRREETGNKRMKRKNEEQGKKENDIFIALGSYIQAIGHEIIC